jgi:hypothetical protein
VHIVVSWDITNASEPGAWSTWNERKGGATSLASKLRNKSSRTLLPLGANPARSAFNITALFQNRSRFEMVDASALADYEYHVIAASLLFGAGSRA